MRSYVEHIAGLAPLLTLEPSVFAPDSDHSSELCGFVLALALAFNDLHDVVVVHDLLMTAQPADVTTPTPSFGEFGGLSVHLFRIQVGTVHEVLELVRKQRTLLRDHSLQQLIQALSSRSQGAWNTLIAAASGKKEHTKLGSYLRYARNHVAFHYDRDKLSEGFAKAFLGGSDRQPYASRGGTLGRSRFYFADAAAQDYMGAASAANSIKDWTIESLELVGEIAFAIYGIVFAFIERRTAA
jgi:hypothetical protein